MYAQVAIKPNTLLRNGAYGIVMKGVQKCTRGCSSLRGRKRLPLCCIKLDTATDTASVSGGNKYEKYFTAPTSSMTCTCTNGQTCSISHSSGVRYIVTINSVSANTTCRVEY